MNVKPVYTQAEEAAKKRLEAGPDPWADLVEGFKPFMKKRKSRGGEWSPVKYLTKQARKPPQTWTDLLFGTGTSAKEQRQAKLNWLKGGAGRAWAVQMGATTQEADEWITKEVAKLEGKPTKTKESPSLAEEVRQVVFGKVLR